MNVLLASGFVIFREQERDQARFRMCGWVCLCLLGSEALEYRIRTRTPVPIRLFRSPG